jgi:hypothetical protein
LKKQMDRLAADLETFSINFDQESRQLEEKAKEMWAERERAEQEAYELQQEEAKENKETKPKSALLGMLQEQAKAKQQETGTSAESHQALNAKLRKAYVYLKDFVREFNAATPAFAGKISLPFVGNLPPVTISEGSVDFLTARVNDKEVIDNISLTYRMISAEKIRATLNKDEARILKAQLDRAEIKCEEKEAGGLFQKVPRVVLTADCRILARIKIRGDYKANIVDFLCQNMGGIGASRFRIAADRFDESAVEEFGKRVLGLPNRFAELKLPD